jgi:hypothetical protein
MAEEDGLLSSIGPLSPTDSMESWNSLDGLGLSLEDMCTAFLWPKMEMFTVSLSAGSAQSQTHEAEVETVVQMIVPLEAASLVT